MRRPAGKKPLEILHQWTYSPNPTRYSVDSETDTLMQNVIRSHFKDQTIIAIAHKLDTILDYDKIAFMDHGRIVEFDTPKALLSREGSAFKAMFDTFRRRPE